jgi:hypothetical protein
MNRNWIVWTAVAWVLSGVSGTAFGDSAEVLPKGVFRAGVQYNGYFSVDSRFDPDGNKESVSRDFNAELNSNVFSSLALVEAGFGMPAGSASIGRSEVDFQYEFSDLILSLQYGLTSKLTVGVRAPYYWNRTDVRQARLDTASATVGKDPSLSFGSPLIPIAIGGTPLTTEDVQKLLGPGLDVNGDGVIDIPGFGYKRIETWSGSGFADIEVGGRYQYYKSDDWRLAFTGGVRLPTGKVDDPDNLIDIGFGTGAYALLFRLNNDYTGIKNVVLNASLKYDLTLPDKQEKRVPSDANRPITTDKEKVKRNLGDTTVLDLSGTYEFSRGWSFALGYTYSSKSKDNVSGDRGFNYRSLEDETDAKYHLASAELSYSTIELFRKKRFPVPMSASIGYEDVFAGKNNSLEQKYITARLAVYF